MPTTGLTARIALVCLCAYVCVCVCERERWGVEIAFISTLTEFVISVENTKDNIEISKIHAL